MPTHFRTCNLCEAICGLEIEYENQTILSIKGDKDDPFSRGHICPKAIALQDLNEDPDRLRHPVKRTENGWKRISWEEAYQEIANQILAIQAKYQDNNVVAVYQGNPNVHNTGSMLASPLFVRSLKTKNRFSATSVDQLPHHLAAYQMFGHQLLLPIPDIDHTDYWLILGGNPLASNGSLMTVPDVAKRLKAIQERGGKVVVIDPRRSETAQKASEHYFIAPQTDVFFLLAIVHALFKGNLVNLGRLNSFTDGLDEIKNIAEPFSPEKVAAITRIPAEEIRKIALEFAQAERAVCYGRMGVSTQKFGSLTQWLINILNILTGNLDNIGGAMFPLPAIDITGLTGFRGVVGSYGRWHSRVRNLPEFGGELPVSALAEEILTEGEGQIKAFITIAGNPVLSTPNGTQLEKALAQLDFMVAIDIYINETTRFAHIILPPTHGLENEHYDLVFHNLAIRNTAKYAPPLFKPSQDTKTDFEIFKELSHQINQARGEDAAAISKDPIKRLSLSAILDLALRYGPYGSKGSKYYRTTLYEEGLTLHKLRQNPHGIDLGALKPCLPYRLFTQNKRIVLAPSIFLEGAKLLENFVLDFQKNTNLNFPFLLIGRRHLRSNNSWMHNSLRLVKGRNRCTLMMNPQDAAQLDFRQGEIVRVSSCVGSISIELEITEELMEGVVSIPHGWGHHRKGSQWKIAEQFAGVSLNDLTDDKEIDTLSGNAALNGIGVRVEKII